LLAVAEDDVGITGGDGLPALLETDAAGGPAPYGTLNHKAFHTTKSG